MLHAGQLRYHDFTLLREARERRRLQRELSSAHAPVSINVGNTSRAAFSAPSFATSSFFGDASASNAGASLQTGRGGSFPPLSLLGGGGRRTLALPPARPQNRTFLTSLRNDLRLKALERAANAHPADVHLQHDFLSQLARTYPEAVVLRFEQFTDFAVDERIALLYLNALQRTGGHRSFALPRFVDRLEKAGVGGPAMAALRELGSGSKGSQGELAARAARALGDAAPAASLGAADRGGSPARPLFIQSADGQASARTLLFTLARHVLVAFVVVSAIAAVFTEQGGGRGLGGLSAMGSGRHIQEAEGSDVRFDDVKGVAEAKAELEEIVLYLKDPERFTRLGGKLPRGVLLTGPPGTGKTLLAKAIAGEAEVPFFFASGSQFEEVYVGLGAKRIRELFEAAKEKSPAIIFIDEIDAVGGSRKLKDQSAMKQTLNELLVQMDGFEENSGIIVIGATNFSESLDSALLRPGRFDKRVSVDLPDVAGRKEILDMYAAKTKIASDVDLSVLARGTTGMSGADLYNLMNQAAVKASVDGMEAITMQIIEWAKDKILMGAEKTSAVITPETAKSTAYHEAGHALVGVLTDGCDPILKATIMPRGNSLGMVMSLPEGDQKSQSFKQMLAYMDMCYGGRIAEELIFGEDNISSGAYSDIKQATQTARWMITKYGFSDNVGIVYYGGEAGGEHAGGQMRNKIDEEVKRISSASYERAKSLLKKHSKEHKLLAETLLEYETLTGDEVRDIVLKGKKPNRPSVNIDGSRGDQSVIKSKTPGEKKKTQGGLAGLAGKLAPRRGAKDDK